MNARDRYWTLIALALAGGIAVGVGGFHVWQAFFATEQGG